MENFVRLDLEGSSLVGEFVVIFHEPPPFWVRFDYRKLQVTSVLGYRTDGERIVTEEKPGKLTIRYKLVPGVHYYCCEEYTVSLEELFYPTGLANPPLITANQPALVLDPMGFLFSSSLEAQAHYRLPVGPSLLILGACCISSGNDELVDALVEAYRGKTPSRSPRDAWIVPGNALIEALGTLGEVKKQEYLYEWMTNWGKKDPVIWVKNPPKGPFFPLSPQAKKAAVIVHSVGCSTIPTHIEYLTNARLLQGYGWGDWFVRSEPEPCTYTGEAKYDAGKHEISLSINAPNFRGEKITVRVTENIGTVIEKVLPFKRGEVNSWVIELGEVDHTYRGGRKISSEEQRRVRWRLAQGLDEYLELVNDFPYRKFWDSTPVRHLVIDPHGAAMLCCTKFTAPFQWWAEILDEIRFSTKRKVIPLGVQITAVRELLRTEAKFAQKCAMLFAILANRTISKTLRMEIIRALIRDGSMSHRDLLKAWNHYRSKNDQPELFIVDSLIRYGIKLDEEVPQLYELLAEFIVLMNSPLYDSLRSVLVDKITKLDLKRCAPWTEKDCKKWFKYCNQAWDETSLETRLKELKAAFPDICLASLRAGMYDWADMYRPWGSCSLGYFAWVRSIKFNDTIVTQASYHCDFVVRWMETESLKKKKNVLW